MRKESSAKVNSIMENRIDNKIKAIGLIFLLLAWGADYFWIAKEKGNLESIEFAVINDGIVHGQSDLNFIKYILQDRAEPKLLALSYRNQLEGAAATALLLKKSGIEPDQSDGDVLRDANSLLAFVNNAYENGLSLEPRDVQRNIRLEVVNVEKRVQRYLTKCLVESKNKYQYWDNIFIWIYLIGSILLILGEWGYGKKIPQK